VSKQKTSKSSTSKSSPSSGSSSKLTKAELETIALEFREELKKVAEGQKTFQDSNGQEFEALKTGLGRLEQNLADFDSRWNINEKQLQTVGEMAALAQQRLDKEHAALGDRPWEKTGEELRIALETNAQKVVDLENGLRKDVVELMKTIQEAAQRVTDLESRMAKHAANLPADREQDIIDLGSRLDGRLNALEDALRENTATGEERMASLEKERVALSEKLEEVREAVLNSTLVPQASSSPAEESSSPAIVAAQPEKAVQDWLHQARLLWNGQRYTNPQAAADCLTRALEIAPENPELLNERGLALADAGFPEKAIVDFSKAILQDASQASAFHNRGLLYMKMDKRDQACRDFRSAAALGDSRALRMAQETGYCGGSVFKKLFRGVID
jgi:tetratricopeptide (TPR) repeat protein